MDRPNSDARDYAVPAHFFDQEATKIARPVVPVGATQTSRGANQVAEKSGRRNLIIGAVALSAIIGSIAGIAAFTLYQKRATKSETTTSLPAIKPPSNDALLAAPTPAPLPGETVTSTDTPIFNETMSPPNPSPMPSTSTSARPANSSANGNAVTNEIANSSRTAPNRNANTANATAGDERRAVNPPAAERAATTTTRPTPAPRNEAEDARDAGQPRVGKRGEEQAEREAEAQTDESLERARRERRERRERRQAERARRIFEGEERQRRNNGSIVDVFEGSRPPR